MEPMKIYWGSGSQPSWRVLLAAELKGIVYDSQLISFQRGEHKTPEFLRMNPRHKVPVIKRGDFACSESLAILAFLEAEFPEPPLFGTRPEETGEIWRKLMEFTLYAEPPLSTIIRALFFGKLEERRSEVEAAISPAQEELEKLERQLDGRKFFMGETVSAIDLVVFPSWMSLLRASKKPEFEGLGLRVTAEKYPALFRFQEGVESLPGYEKTYPPHWREG